MKVENCGCSFNERAFFFSLKITEYSVKVHGIILLILFPKKGLRLWEEPSLEMKENLHIRKRQ